MAPKGALSFSSMGVVVDAVAKLVFTLTLISPMFPVGQRFPAQAAPKAHMVLCYIWMPFLLVCHLFFIPAFGVWFAQLQWALWYTSLAFFGFSKIAKALPIFSSCFVAVMILAHLFLLPLLDTLGSSLVWHLLLLFTVDIPALAWVYCLHHATIFESLPVLPEEKSPKSVVVVGNGPSLLNTEQPCGSQIDAADCVVRFNTFKRDPTEAVGSNTTYHTLGTCKVLPDPKSGVQYVLPLVNATLTHKVYVIFENLRRVPELKASLKGGHVFLVSEKQTRELIKELELESGKIPTSGTSMIGWAVKAFTKVNIIGFDFFTQGFHYYAEPVFVDLQQQMERGFTHSPDREKELVQKWISEGKLAFLGKQKEDTKKK